MGLWSNYLSIGSADFQSILAREASGLGSWGDLAAERVDRDGNIRRVYMEFNKKVIKIMYTTFTDFFNRRG